MAKTGLALVLFKLLALFLQYIETKTGLDKSSLASG
jgi:hypothetical protein